MIRLQTLGTLDLRSEDGRDVGALLAQPKRLSLLCYLAVATPRGFHRRDTLLGLFWPELDAKRARGALNLAVHHLRRTLGADVVVSRGKQDLGLDWDRFRCDVVDFNDALDVGALDAALDLYGGDLLEGFFLSGAVEFERWIARERAAVRARAATAAWTLAEQAEADRRTPDAVRWARRAVECEQRGESAVRRQIELLGRIGDRAEALRTYEEFARWMRQEFETEPSEKTRGLVERIRGGGGDRTAGGDGGMQAGVGAGAPGVMASEPAAPEPNAGDPNAANPHAPAPVAPTPWGPDATAPERGALESAGVESAGVERAAPAPAASDRPADRSQVESDAVVADGARGGVASGRRGRRQRAASWAVGSAVLVAVVAALVVAFLRPAEPEPPGAVRGTASPVARAAYLEGEREQRAGRYDAAVEAYQRAVAADAGFALAFLRLSQAANWTGQPDLAKSAADAARRLADRLDPHDRVRAEAWHAYLFGWPGKAEPLFRRVVAADPSDADGWFYLGETIFHWGPTLGWPAAASRESWERVLALEPGNTGARTHLARILAGGRDAAAFDSVAARLTAAPAGPGYEAVLELRALRAFAFGDRAERRRVVEELENTGEAFRQHIVTAVATHAGDPAGALELARRFTPSQGKPQGRVWALLMRAQLEAARGRPNAAAAELVPDEALPPARALEYEAALRTLPFLPTPAAVIERVRDALANLPSGPPKGPGTLSITINGIYPPAALYLGGLLALRADDLAGAGHAAATLERFRGDTPMDSAYAARFARILRAAIARTRGDPARALAALGAPEPDRTLPQILSYPEAHARWLRAELLRELGRDEEALRWYATFPDPQGYDLSYLAPAHLRRAEILAELGEDAKAMEHYRRFIALWREAEPALRPRVADARQRVRR